LRTKTYNNPPLSRRELALVSTWERERRSRIRLGELRSTVGAVAPSVAHRLARKGVLQRIGRGIYLIRPVRLLARPSSGSAAAALAALFEDKPYYLGGLWALSLHRLTTQAHLSNIDVFAPQRGRTRQILNARVTFHALPKASFSFGVRDVQMEGANIRVSDPERTVLDLLDHPAAAGGTRRTVRLAASALPRLNRKTLIQYAAQWGRTSTCQRLGVLLERAGARGNALRPLMQRAAETKSLLSLIADAPRAGRVNARWRIVENDR